MTQHVVTMAMSEPNGKRPSLYVSVSHIGTGAIVSPKSSIAENEQNIEFSIYLRLLLRQCSTMVVEFAVKFAGISQNEELPSPVATQNCFKTPHHGFLSDMSLQMVI